MRNLVAGVDGGGTRTRVAVATAAGELLGIGEAGSGNLHDIGASALAENLDSAVAQAFEKAGRITQQLDAVFLGLGSIVTEEDRAAIRQIVAAAPWAPQSAIGVDHDLRIAHMGCLGGAPGIVLIAGTGSSCYGRDAEGRSWKSGGWGPLLDDLGSGHWLGRQAMIAAIRESDGRGPATSLSGAVLSELGVTTPLHLLHRVEMTGLSRAEIASLSRLVVDAAKQGDGVARAILDRGAAELADLAAAVAAKLGMADPRTAVHVSATGGLVEAGEHFLAPLRSALAQRLPRAEFIPAKAPPVLGAVMLAAEMLRQTPVNREFLARLLA